MTDGSDPSRSPTLHLQRFIRRSARGCALVPPTFMLPNAPPPSPSGSSDSSGTGSPASAQSRNPELHERLRLARFRFPPHGQSVRPTDFPDLFSPPPSSSRRNSSNCAQTNVDTLNEDDGWVFNQYYRHKHGKSSEGASYGMLNFYDAKLDEENS